MILSGAARKFKLALESHRNALYSQYVPIRKRGQQKLVVNKVAHFGVALLVIFLATLYGTLGLPYESSNQNDNWLGKLATDPTVFSHQMAPKSFWFHFDIATTLTISASVITLLYVAFRAEIGDAFTIVQVNGSTFILGGEQLEGRICKRISHFHRWTVFLTYSTVVLFYILAMTFYMVNVWLHNAYTVTFGSAVYWFALFPAFIFYMVYAIIGFQMNTIVSSRIIRIRQETLREKLVQLNAVRLGHTRKANKASSRKWFQYLKLNAELLSICQHTAQYRHQNVPILSVLVPYLMLIMSYVTTVALFGDPANLPFCLLAFIQCNSWLYLITHECAQIDRLNESLEREMRVFYVDFCTERKISKVAIGAQLKAQLFQTNDRLHPYVFSLLGDFRITSQTFYSILLYTSSYFMFHFKGHSVTF